MPYVVKRITLLTLYSYTDRHLLRILSARVDNLDSSPAVFNQTCMFRDAIHCHVLLDAERVLRPPKQLFMSIPSATVRLRVFPAEEKLNEAREMPKGVVGRHTGETRHIVLRRRKAEPKDEVITQRLRTRKPTRYKRLHAPEGI